MNLPKGSDRAELTERLIADLGAAFQQRAVYAPGHPQVKAAIVRVLSDFAAWCAQAGTAEVSLITLEGQVLVDRQAIPEDAAWARGLLRAFRRHGIRGLTMVVGLDAEEMELFFESCQNAKGPTPSRHLLLGQAGFAAGDSVDGASGAGAPSSNAPASLSPEQVESAREELVGVAAGAVTRIDQLRGLVAWLARSTDPGALHSLCLAAASINDREFLHGLAVAIATLRLARALRIEGKSLEDLALCGLVHDVGYLEPVRPQEDPAETRRAHPIRGAVRLAALDGIPDIAVLVAYEHHLRVDKEVNYPAVSVPRAPIPEARVVAVADTWDTLRSHGGTQPAEALAILRGRAGTFLDPALVELFSELVRGAPRSTLEWAR